MQVLRSQYIEKPSVVQVHRLAPGTAFITLVGCSQDRVEFEVMLSRQEAERLRAQLAEVFDSQEDAAPENLKACCSGSSMKALPRWTFTPYTTGTPGGYRGVLVDEHGGVAGYLDVDNNVTLATAAL